MNTIVYCVCIRDSRGSYSGVLAVILSAPERTIKHVQGDLAMHVII